MASPIIDPINCPDLCSGCKIDRPLIGLDDWARCLCFGEGTAARWNFWQLGQSMFGGLPLSGTADPDQNGDDLLKPPTIPFDCDKCNCGYLLYNDSGQGGTGIAGRDEIWRAIRTASYAFQTAFKKRNGYYPTITQDCFEYNPRYHDQPMINFANFMGALNYAGQEYRLRLPCKKVKGFGLEVEDMQGVFGDENTLEFLDTNDDQIVDTVQLTIPSAGFQSTDEVRLFFNEVDSVGKDLYRNEIRPLCVTEEDDGSGGTNYVIEFPSRLGVPPRVYVNSERTALDPNSLDIRAENFRVSRHWFDESRGVVLMRKINADCNCRCSCQIEGETQSESGCYACEMGQACFFNAEEGIIDVRRSADGGGGCCGCEECIDRICINYRSGDCLDVDCIVARFAASLLRHKTCCSQTDCMDDAQGDFVAIHESAQGSVKLINPLTKAEKLLVSAFGTRRGGIEAMRYTMMHKSIKSYVGVV